MRDKRYLLIILLFASLLLIGYVIRNEDIFEKYDSISDYKFIKAHNMTDNLKKRHI